jgi:hypothetical protein
MLLPLVAGLFLPLVASAVAYAEEDHGDDGHGNGHRPVYQRHAFDRKHDRHDGRDFRRGFPLMMPPVSSGWFQRPYPYHLDYYKMRYGGSYAPYFGNLYGPPEVVTAPPYYGPYNGDYGSGYSNGYGPGYGGMMGAYPAMPNYVMPGAEVEQSNAVEMPAK